MTDKRRAEHDFRLSKTDRRVLTVVEAMRRGLPVRATLLDRTFGPGFGAAYAAWREEQHDAGSR